MDVRDSRSRNLFLFEAGQMDLDALKAGAAIDAPTVSASMATALLAYSGIAVKMLVDKRLDAQLGIMFMVEYEPGGVAHPHDHPLEESYLILEGEVEAVADDRRYTLKKGDFLWTGVGCVHAFYNTSAGKVRWLETAAPQPPDRHSYRFNRDWEYLEQKLQSEAETGQPKAV
jgi:quercetin dioxygenase-like cupin family protein